MFLKSQDEKTKKIKTFKTFRLTNFLVFTFGFISLLIGVFCIIIRLPVFMSLYKNDIDMIAARLAFPNTNCSTSTCKSKENLSTNDFFQDPKVPEFKKINSEIDPNISVPEKKQVDDDYDKRHCNEKKYTILESQIGASGSKYNNFYIKKSVGLDVSIEHELTLRPDINIKKDGSPEVLIYHTHTTESYMKRDCGFYYESFYPRTTDNNFNVTQVGAAITKSLQQNGIGVIHDTTVHDSPSYNGSYSRSVKTIEKNLSEHPSIQVTIDIHRDSIGGNDSGKVKPTFKVGGKKAAQIMIMSGCDEDGSLEFPDWEYNLRFALLLQDTAEKMYPGMTRPMCFGDFKYNMHMTHGSLLIEVGTDANTLEEAKYTGSLLGQVLSNVLSQLQKN